MLGTGGGKHEIKFSNIDNTGILPKRRIQHLMVNLFCLAVNVYSDVGKRVG